MIKHFHVLYVGQIALDNVGLLFDAQRFPAS
jgi:hypothetical protein